MLIKKPDSQSENLKILQRLQEFPLTSNQRFHVERELSNIKSGARGEKDTAYFLEFEYRDSRNWAIIHDLRLEQNGFVAQIDHLLINRFLETYVLESKNFHYGIKITEEGEFLVRTNNGYKAIESPLEQNRRHIQVLGEVIKASGITPTRLGIPIPLTFHNYVLVAPKSRVNRPPGKRFDSSAVVKADAFISAVRKRYDTAGPGMVASSLAKVVSSETLESFAKALAFRHKRGGIDYPAKFGITVPTTLPPVLPAPESVTVPYANNKKAGDTCTQCGAVVTPKVADYCRMKKQQFSGQVLCWGCQQAVRFRG
jgi:hypothetical protein